jgi:hypothetical protein
MSENLPGASTEEIRAEIEAAVYAHLMKSDAHRIPQSKEGLDELYKVLDEVCAKYIPKWEIELGPELTPEERRKGVCRSILLRFAEAEKL